mmetsp:Transcript_24381/g.28706  ORF Transcript_24381/g.28706 Transcript_24381/m.28706 type:complete len:88 (+) Transcript_24381:409-672(+)
MSLQGRFSNALEIHAKEGTEVRLVGSGNGSTQVHVLTLNFSAPKGLVGQSVVRVLMGSPFKLRQTAVNLVKTQQTMPILSLVLVYLV